jgi:TM2 domain-containing membrane protein YozV
MKPNSLFVLFFLFLILFTSSSAFPQPLNVNKLKLNYKNSFFTDTTKTVLTEKNPLLAGTLSFIVPGVGLGQIYNGQEEKFHIHSLISLGCWFLFFASGGNFNEFALWGPDGINFGFGLALLAYAGNWVWSVVDAIVSANDINKQVKLQKYRSNTFGKIKFGLIVNERKQINIKFVF